MQQSDYVSNEIACNKALDITEINLSVENFQEVVGKNVMKNVEYILNYHQVNNCKRYTVCIIFERKIKHSKQNCRNEEDEEDYSDAIDIMVSKPSTNFNISNTFVVIPSKKFL